MNTTNIISTTEPVAAVTANTTNTGTGTDTDTANSNYDDNDNNDDDNDNANDNANENENENENDHGSIILDGNNSSGVVNIDIDIGASPGAATAGTCSTSTSTSNANSTSPTPTMPTSLPTSTSSRGGASSTSTSADSTPLTPPSTSPTPTPPILLIDNPTLQAVKKIHIQRGNEHNDDEHEHGQQKQKQVVQIISLSECIYGNRNESNDDDDNDKHDSEATTTEDNTAIPTASRNHRRHRRHDIDISILRKLCSTYGSTSSTSDHDPNAPNDPDDHLRGVMWRIVLGQLPTNDIYNTWSTTLTTQRKLYQELISTYLNCSNDNPTSSNSRFANQNKTQQQQQQQHSTSTSIQTNQKYQEQEQEQELLDASLDLSPICLPTIQTTTEDDNNEDNDNENDNWCNASRYQESMYICLDENIYNEFPNTSKYKELWKQSGITLNKGQSASSIGMNILQVPKELLATDNDDANQDDANQDDENELKSSKISTSSRNDKIFNHYIRDAKTLMEIRKDVVRTHPTLQFYTEPKDNLGIRRHAAIERILFIWAKLNGNLYVQGMNEIVGTIYYVLANDKSKYPMNNNNSNNSNNNTSSSDDYWSNYAECDTYYLFHNLMLVDDIRDVYHQDLDHESNPTGLHGRISNIELLIKKHDPILYKHLVQNLNIDTSFYTIRWLTTLLSREFLLNDTIRLWDSMFSSTNKENFLRYFCATMVINIRSKLLCGDFGTCLKLLQNYPSKSGDGDGDGGDRPSSSISSIVDTLLESSRSLWIYESQITLACHKGGLSLNDALQMIKPPINDNHNGTIIMAYGVPGGIYDVSSTSTIIENASTVTGQVLDILSTTAAATATVAASTRITAVVPMQKNVSRMFGNAKRIFNNRYNNSNTNNSNNNNNAATTTNNSVDDDDNNCNNDGTASTTTNTNATTIIDDGWDIIDSIIGGNNEYLQHKRLIEDSTTTTTTTTTISIGLVGVGDDDDDEDDNRDCRRISQPSSPPSALGARTTTTTASTSITDIGIGIGGPVLLTNAKNRLWNRINGTPAVAATTSTSFPTNDSTITTNNTAANPINSKNDRFWNRRGGGSSGGR